MALETGPVGGSDLLALDGQFGADETLWHDFPSAEVFLRVQGASAFSYDLDSQGALIGNNTAEIEAPFHRSSSDVSSNTVNDLGLCDSFSLQLQQPAEQLGTPSVGSLGSEQLNRSGSGVPADTEAFRLDLPSLPALLIDAARVGSASTLQQQYARQPGILAGPAAALDIPHSAPACVSAQGSAGGAPAAAPADSHSSSICSTCSKLVPVGHKLADSILAGSTGRVELNEQIGNFVLRAARSCDRVIASSSSTSGKGLARPCLFADREQLASPSNQRCWGLALSKARAAESGAKRARNGTLKPWNVNWNTNSPQLLSQQDELLSIMGSGSSSGSVSRLVGCSSSGSAGSSKDILLNGGDSSGGSSDTGTAGNASRKQQAPGVYVVRSADSKAHVIAYAVAHYHPDGLVPPVMLAGAVPVDVSNDLWGNKMKCSKKGHALAQKDLSLFKYAFVVVCA